MKRYYIFKNDKVVDVATTKKCAIGIIRELQRQEKALTLAQFFIIKGKFTHVPYLSEEKRERSDVK